MTTAVNGKTTPTITGILLVGKQEALYRCVPTATASFQVLEGTEVRVNQEYRRPILYTIETIREMFVPWNPSREVNDGLFRQSVPEFDERAFREALVNAFGHRDYAAMGSVRTLVRRRTEHLEPRRPCRGAERGHSPHGRTAWKERVPHERPKTRRPCGEEQGAGSTESSRARSHTGVLPQTTAERTPRG